VGEEKIDWKKFHVGTGSLRFWRGYVGAADLIELRIAYLDKDKNVIDGNAITFKGQDCYSIASTLANPLNEIMEGYPNVEQELWDYPGVKVKGLPEGDASISNGTNQIVISKADIPDLVKLLEADRPGKGMADLNEIV
jgi:hypothetical protein